MNELKKFHHREFFQHNLMMNVLGVLCFFYFLFYFSSNEESVAKIFPPYPYWALILFAVAVLMYQLFVWRKMELLQPKLFFRPYALFSFASEFFILSFSICLLSWFLYPFVLFFRYFLKAG